MRYHEAFTIIPRKMPPSKQHPKGITVFYYRTRTVEGGRTSAFSTGQTTKSAARAHCRELEKAGKLIPEKPAANEPPKLVTFEDLSVDFWSWDNSAWIRDALAFSDPDKPKVSRRYCDDMARIVELYLLPSFRRRHLAEITPQEVEAFSLRIRKEHRLSGKRVNNIVSCLRTMLYEAFRAKIILWDPKEKGIIRAMGHKRRQRGRLTLEEAQRLFAPEAIDTAWKGHTLYRAINLAAAVSACRQGELLALHDQDVHADYLEIKRSWSIVYGEGPTKTRVKRIAPLLEIPGLPSAYEALRPFLGARGYVFSMTKGETPCTGNRVTGALYAALDEIGVKDRAERNVTFHGWRHFTNSMMIAMGISGDLTRKVTGHETAQMTENYLEVLREDFARINATMRKALPVQAEVSE